MDWLQQVENVLNDAKDAYHGMGSGKKERMRVLTKLYDATCAAHEFLKQNRLDLKRKRDDDDDSDSDDIEESDEDSSGDLGNQTLTGTVGLTLYEILPFNYDGIQYMTAMTAFQAQKAPPNERSQFSNLLPIEAAKLGRSKTIDIGKWDAGRLSLIIDILYEQAMQNAKIRNAILTYADADYTDDSAPPDPWWQQNLSSIWKQVKKRLNVPLTLPESDDDDDKS